VVDALGVLDLLRGHVVGRADDPSGVRQVGAGPLGHRVLGDAEVAHLHAERAVALVEEDVGGLDVPVHHAQLVDGGEALAGLEKDPGGDAGVEGTHLTDDGAEVLALEEFHDEEGELPGAAGGGVEDPDDVGVLDGLHGFDLAGEASASVGVLLAADELEGDGLAGGGEGAVDGAHAALAEELEDAVALVEDGAFEVSGVGGRPRGGHGGRGQGGFTSDLRGGVLGHRCLLEQSAPASQPRAAGGVTSGRPCSWPCYRR
jgi:hypothetical protein